MRGLYGPRPENKHNILNLGEFKGEFHGSVIQTLNLMEPNYDGSFHTIFLAG